VDQDVAEGDDLRPGHSRISASQCHRDASAASPMIDSFWTTALRTISDF
jgi:hypothetical protein